MFVMSELSLGINWLKAVKKDLEKVPPCSSMANSKVKIGNLKKVTTDQSLKLNPEESSFLIELKDQLMVKMAKMMKNPPFLRTKKVDRKSTRLNLQSLRHLVC